MAEIGRKYVGAPFKIGGWSREEGMDCFTLLMTVLDEMGYETPDDFEGYTRETYHEAWLENPLRALVKLENYIRSFADELPRHQARPGDVLIFDEDGATGICAGNALVMAATRAGVQMLNVSAYPNFKVYRCRKKPS